MEYVFAKPCIAPDMIYADIPSVVNIPTPDSIANEMIMFYGQSIYNMSGIVFTFSTALTGPEEAALNSYMSTFDGLPTDDDKINYADAQLNLGFQIVMGINAKMQLENRTDEERAAWFSQIEGMISALNAGFLSVALDRLTSLTSILTNFLTGTMTSSEVTELRQLLQKLLGKTLT